MNLPIFSWFCENLLNISWSNFFGKLIFIVYMNDMALVTLTLFHTKGTDSAHHPFVPTWFENTPPALNRAKAAPARNIREGASLPNQWEKRENMQPPNLLCQAWSIFFLLCKTWNGKKYVIQNVKTVLPFFMKMFIIFSSDGIVFISYSLSKLSYI